MFNGQLVRGELLSAGNLGTFKVQKILERYSYLIIFLLVLVLAEPVLADDDSEQKKENIKDSVSQGLTVREAMTLNQSSPYSYSASFSSFRSADYYDEAYMNLGGDFAYRLGNQQSLTASVDYLVPMDRLDPDPKRYGFSDVYFSWLSPNLGTIANATRLAGSLTIQLPASERSQRETLYGSLSGSLALRRPLSGSLSFLSLSFNGTAILSAHQYETADAFGTRFNSPFGVALGAGAIASITDNLIWSNSFSVYSRMDYSNHWIFVETLSSTATYLLSKDFQLFAQYRWRDEAITNDAFLDDDKSRLMLGGSYFF